MGSGAFLVETCRQLADALIDAWSAHGAMPTIPPDEDEVIYARRLIAQKCLYGIDRNPMAVDLAKVSMWLSTLARDHPLTFVDHAFRHGDSLVGLTRRQIEALNWKGGQPFLAGFGVREAVEAASDLRRQIREADDTVDERRLQNLWREAQDAVGEVRLFGDLVLAAFFEGAKPKERESRRAAYQEAILTGEAWRHAVEMEERRNSEQPFAPFHWEIVFPEVFERDNPGFDGFDGFVGNPPFAGKNNVAAGNVVGYPSWLKELHEESHGNADLVAQFYRRAFSLLRDSGTFGLIATNTIAQGDTRSSGLRWICEHGGVIYRATKRVQWPGDAAVIVSVLHVAKGPFRGRKVLDGARRRQYHRVPVPPGPPRGSGTAGGQRRQELRGQLRPRHGLHLRRQRQEGRRIFTRRHATAHRLRPPQPRSYLPLHRRRRDQHQPHARPPPLRDQLRRAG